MKFLVDSLDNKVPTIKIRVESSEVSIDEGRTKVRSSFGLDYLLEGYLATILPDTDLILYAPNKDNSHIVAFSSCCGQSSSVLLKGAVKEGYSFSSTDA